MFLQLGILDPAINGTLNVLRSCKKNQALKRVVLTSSSSTVRIKEDIDPKVPLDETSWSSMELCKRLQVNLNYTILFSYKYPRLDHLMPCMILYPSCFSVSICTSWSFPFRSTSDAIPSESCFCPYMLS